MRDNPGLLLSAQGKGKDATYNIVGARNSKAWVRGVSELLIVGAATLGVDGALAQPGTYDPDDWQFDMDSTNLDVGDGVHKYQGVPLGEVLAEMQPRPEAQTVVLSTGGEPVSLPLAQVLEDEDLRLFTIIGQTTLDVTFALARMNGEVLAPRVTAIQVQ